jgi:transmembrane sensor
MKKHQDHGFPTELSAEADRHELQEIWSVLGRGAPSPVSPEATDRAWDALAGRLGLLDSKPTVDESRSRWGLGRVFLRAAAILLLATGVTAAWHAVPVTRAAGPGESVAVVLPDGSAVELNAGSSLSYTRGFAWLPGLSRGMRSVSLQGEAFFDVRPGVRPFRVEAGPADVRVLGTRFNVRARGSGAAVDARVEVEEGRVEVWDADRTSSLILSAGEAARFRPGSGRLAREAVEPTRIASWRSGGLTVVDEPLSAILLELSLRYGVRVVLTDPEAGRPRLSVYYPELDSLESVLSDLATQQNLQYRRTNDGWELF